MYMRVQLVEVYDERSNILLAVSTAHKRINILRPLLDLLLADNSRVVRPFFKIHLL